MNPSLENLTEKHVVSDFKKQRSSSSDPDIGFIFIILFISLANAHLPCIAVRYCLGWTDGDYVDDQGLSEGVSAARSLPDAGHVLILYPHIVCGTLRGVWNRHSRCSSW